MTQSVKVFVYASSLFGFAVALPSVLMGGNIVLAVATTAGVALVFMALMATLTTLIRKRADRRAKPIEPLAGDEVQRRGRIVAVNIPSVRGYT
jgi:hypothetical protein